MEFIDYLIYIVVFALIIAIMVLFTKYLGYRTKKLQKGNYMTIIETLSLGVNNRLILVKVEEEFLILSVSNKSSEFIAKVNIQDYKEQEEVNPFSDIIDFKAILAKNIIKSGSNKKHSSPDKKDTLTNEDTQAQNTSSVKNTFKSNLDKLKKLNRKL